MRVYLPATLTMLDRWLAAGSATATDLDSAAAVCAVTPTLREWYHDADLDELEHAAQVDASIGSLHLLAVDTAAGRRRVVLAIDVADDAVRGDPQRGRSAVRISGSFPVAAWACALIDAPDAEGAVRVAVAGLDAAGAGDADARFALGEAEAYELGWYAVQELPHVVR
jgi:hypothetical protein